MTKNRTEARRRTRRRGPGEDGSRPKIQPEIYCSRNGERRVVVSGNFNFREHANKIKDAIFRGFNLDGCRFGWSPYGRAYDLFFNYGSYPFHIQYNSGTFYVTLSHIQDYPRTQTLDNLLGMAANNISAYITRI